MLALLLALPVSACVGVPRGPVPEVSAAPASDGVRVRFRRLTGADADRPPELSAGGGTLEEVTFSPDLKAVSVLWREPRGTLSCHFPYDGTALFDAGSPVDTVTVAYVFLESEGVRVTAALPRGCLLLPALPLRLRIDEALSPARLVLPDGRSIAIGANGEVLLPLTMGERGVLRRGDMPVAIETAKGPIEFLVGVDDDGTPAAVSGHVDLPASREDTGDPGIRDDARAKLDAAPRQP